MSNTVIEALGALSPGRGPMNATCAWLLNASPDEIAAIRAAFARGNTHTAVARAIRANTSKGPGGYVTIPGIKEHWLRDEACDTCHISLRS